MAETVAMLFAAIERRDATPLAVGQANELIPYVIQFAPRRTTYFFYAVTIIRGGVDTPLFIDAIKQARRTADLE